MLIREIEARDNAQIEKIIRACLLEYDGARPGTAWYDPNLGRFSELYGEEGARYWVAEEDGRVVGGCGVGPLPGNPGVCELQKMYCLPKARGTGIAAELLKRCLRYAEGRYTSCYLETFGNMIPAQRFYEKNGFEKLSAPLPGTGHFGCDVWYLKKLKKTEEENADAGI
ncbi:GNAT family N-acetyltransferase [Zongyangia hominis]|uniref:GNAT family N-acetyltransferase n=1 Tax=Zongyangia hominis TaxID=2763677 RepID=A0A926EEP9_9FIRM|nr:GNAT family N-acetyltransferase [Zongyangia hominis]MBC8570804.1 GNAT family N-acetyltransferase [Zongyangia hominis]